MLYEVITVVYHLTISHHGPGLLRPLLARHEETTKSEILDEARRNAEFEQHRHFHNVAPEYPRPPENLRSVCFICHSDLVITSYSIHYTKLYDNLMLTHLPVDLTFVDENDRVAYYSEGPERIFPRSPAIIGREVRNCHPRNNFV